jgi:hypothetical protein
MKTLNIKIRQAINRGAHEVAQRFEFETREQWAKTCQAALNDGEDDAALLARITSLTAGMR